jgi:hypothetical protein
MAGVETCLKFRKATVSQPDEEQIAPAPFGGRVVGQMFATVTPGDFERFFEIGGPAQHV